MNALRLLEDTATDHTARVRGFPSTVAFAALAILVCYLPFSAINGVLGTVGASAGVGTGQLRWVTDAFTVTLTVAVLAGGALAQRHGARSIVLTGLGVTVLAGAVGWLAGSVGGPAGVHVLQVAQALAGTGAGVVMAAGLALIAATAPDPGARARAISLWAAANVVGLGAGPFLSGAVTAVASWHWAFLPVVVAALAVTAYGVTRALPGPPTSEVDVVRGVRRLLAQAPRLFAHRGFAAAGLAAAVVLFAVIGVVFELSLFLHAHQVSELGIAVRLGCLFAGNALASVASGPLQRRFGLPAVLVGGLAVLAIGLVALLALHDTSVVQVGWRVALVGLGAGPVIATGAALAIQSVPGALAPAAGTVHNCTRQLGGALSTAVLGGALHAAVLVLVALVAVTAAATVGLLVREP
jgi:MFS family permease